MSRMLRHPAELATQAKFAVRKQTGLGITKFRDITKFRGKTRSEVEAHSQGWENKVGTDGLKLKFRVHSSYEITLLFF